jgi:hypothetical protein
MWIRMGEEMSENQDRRHSKRIQIIAYAFDEKSNKPEIYFIDEINERGAYLVTHNPPEIGTQLHLRISVRLMPDDIDLIARVVRHGIRGFAVQFEDPSEYAKNLLRKQLYGSVRDNILSRFRRYRVKLR